MKSEALKQEIMNLPLVEKLELMTLLTESIRDEEGAISDAWIEESERRVALFEAGKMASVDAETVLSSLRRK